MRSHILVPCFVVGFSLAVPAQAEKLPMPGSPALTGGVPVPGNQFFDATMYRGGFNGRDDWTGFGHQVKGGQ